MDRFGKNHTVLVLFLIALIAISIIFILVYLKDHPEISKKQDRAEENFDDVLPPSLPYQPIQIENTIPPKEIAANNKDSLKGQELPVRCTIQTGLDCVNSKVTADTILMRIINNLGMDMADISVNAQDCGKIEGIPKIGKDNARNVEIKCDKPLTQNRYEGQFNVSFNVEGTGIKMTYHGSLSSSVN